MNPTAIRILEKDNNRRGDLFGRLMADLFVALGYEMPALNVHKSGRELDLSAKHRIEPRRAIGECKATADPIGGDDINKFIGTLDAEHDDQPIMGYFISLSGFKETAIEQERQRRRTKIALLTGSDVISHLITGRILIPKERATELAGRCCSGLNSLVLDSNAELLAHQRGWIWTVYFTQGKSRTHFALIHSDGTPLARAVADEVIAADRLCGGILHQLCCLNPEPAIQSSSDAIAHALSAYREYLEAECGFIQLDGLPADTEVGSRRLRLENLFVPLHLNLAKKPVPVATKEANIEKGRQEPEEVERRSVGNVLTEHPRLALLAAPGGGKSTLLKRLAVAYADPARREQVTDELPQRDWVPLFFRCRELRSLARGSFAELLEALSQREGVRQHASAFRSYVDRMLLAGQVLLLVDGLDEISDAGDRAAFVCTIRAAVQAYPGVAMVVTSREAGFRHVAAHLAPICTRATLAPFNPDDITRLSVSWHREVMGNTEKIRLDAEALATTIIKNDRIRRLAVNPLLLTTLLLVKRWVGSLPTRRAVLYGKAVELLLMTWNVEGHEPIPQEEALPQLCYVASAMMLKGTQKISRPRLAALLKEARNALPTELGYVQGTVDEFIQRVEERSSLLMMTGLDVESGQLVEFFEFRHLTFQEFLTAKAMVEEWHPGRTENDTLAKVLTPHFDEEKWAEVIPLAAVLGGKATEMLMQTMTETISAHASVSNMRRPIMIQALGNSLADEAAARPETIKSALKELVRFDIENERFVEPLSKGRYGADFREEALKKFQTAAISGTSSPLLAKVLVWQALETVDTPGVLKAAARFDEMIKSNDRLARIQGAAALSYLCFLLYAERQVKRDNYQSDFQKIGQSLKPMLFSPDEAEQVAALWAIVWLGASDIPVLSEGDTLARVFMLWRQNRARGVGFFSAWVLTDHPLIDRKLIALGSLPESEIHQLLRDYDNMEEREKPALIIAAWYSRAVQDNKIFELIKPLLGKQEAEVSTASRLKQLRVLVANAAVEGTTPL